MGFGPGTSLNWLHGAQRAGRFRQVNTTFLPGDDWVAYRRLPLGEADCKAMRPLDEYLGLVADIVIDWRPSCKSLISRLEQASSRAHHWLQLASSLSFVDICSDHLHPDTFMCSGAADYYENDDLNKAAYATEHTRLLYTWNAVEQLLRGLPLASRNPAAQGPWRKATERLLTTWRTKDLPDHYECVAEHLRRHLAQRTEVYASVLEMFAPADWRG